MSYDLLRSTILFIISPGLVAESEYIEFESMVCYAFLTRFPLFDFFFQVIFDLINTGMSLVYCGVIFHRVLWSM